MAVANSLSGSYLGCSGIHEAPEGVLDPVEAHVDRHEEVVSPTLEETVADDEVLLRESIDVPQDPRSVFRAEVRNVEEELAVDPVCDLALQLGGET